MIIFNVWFDFLTKWLPVVSQTYHANVFEFLAADKTLQLKNL